MDFKNYIQSSTGYTLKTTFWQDFSIANIYGEAAIRDTYKRAFNEWQSDVVYITELAMVLNWQLFMNYDNHRLATAKLYDELWRDADSWCMDNLKGDDLTYYIKTTD